MIRKFLVLLLISLLLIPSMVHAEEKEYQTVQQIPVVNQNYNYTLQIEDFRDKLASYNANFSTGIYTGPHLPPVLFSLSYTGCIEITAPFQLGFDMFTYGASDYYIYIPILNPPNSIAMKIEIGHEPDNWIFLEDKYFDDASKIDYSMLQTHHLIEYIPNLGYILHNPFFPLKSEKTYYLNISIYPYTTTPLEIYLTQENTATFGNITVEIGTHFTSVYKDLAGIMKKISGVPLAFAFLATQGLTSFGLGAVELPGDLGLELWNDNDPLMGKFATLNMPYHFTTPDEVIINYTWTAPASGTDVNIQQKQITAFVKNFIIHSTDTVIDDRGGEYPHYAKFIIYPLSMQKNYIIFVSTNAHFWGSDPENYTRISIYDRTQNKTLFDDDYIIGSINPTKDRYVALNSSTWTISRLEFAQMALQNALLLQYYDLQSTSPLGSIAGFYANIAQMIELTKAGARKLGSNIINIGFTTNLNLPNIKNTLQQLGHIVWQTLLKFWNYVTRELMLFWNWIAPVLQLALYFIFIIGVMVLMKYLSKIFIRRERNAS